MSSSLACIFKILTIHHCPYTCDVLCAEDGKETANNDGPENNSQPQYTTVYVGNLAPEAGNPSLRFYFIIPPPYPLVTIFMSLAE